MKLKKIFAVCLSVLIILSACSLSAWAITFSVGAPLGSGIISSASNRTVAPGVTYSTAVYRDSSNDL